MVKVEYSTESERNSLIGIHIAEGMFLIEDAIIDGGRTKYLIFDNAPLNPQDIQELAVENYLLDLDFRLSSLELGL